MPNVYEFKDFEGSSHRILIELLRRFTPPGGALLDLGASAGHLGAAVRDHFDRTIGFEYEVACIGSLHKIFNDAAIADLETIRRLPHVDAIVLGDVLEHLRDPASLLRLVHDSLGGKGRAFISVPNIANVTVRLGLLFGVFEYRDRGILDNTHLRFYTMRTIKRQIEEAGFRILAVRGSSVPVRLIVGKWMPEPILRLGEWLLTLLTRLWKSLFAYQIIIVAAPR
ncbi:MAG TPA: class I SAM-dependent methyltransferase [Thermoanaerobaculia bacterium]|jgi:2-polyprenyl-3-methyl-5-hydroxy-6-metoxy-1,4-benzoquinol methylase|nr:class I SAM-dependent methyltransferase [Thermoanaerobaculia bacterium]